MKPASWKELIELYIDIVDPNSIRSRYEDYKYNLFENRLKSRRLSLIADRDTVINTSATEEEIKEAESRIGLELPPSYKKFLQFSNGLHWRNNPVHLLPVEDINRLEIINNEAIEALNFWYDKDDEEDLVEYLESYKFQKDPQKNGMNLSVLERYSKELVQVSIESEFGFILLNPKRTHGKEWEVYDASWEPDMTLAFASFDEYLIYAISSNLDLYTKQKMREI